MTVHRLRPLIHLLLFIVCSITGTVAMAIEEPRYDVVANYDGWEVRRYEPYIVARTWVDKEFEDAGSEAFRRLADYIFGNNAEEQKIAMTAPVSQQPTESSSGYWVTFMMPSEYSMDELPEPVDERIELLQVPAGLFAAIRYRGGWSEDRYRQHESQLLNWINDSKSWKEDGNPVWARYNPPFMPSFLRRNEVLMPVAAFR